MGEASTSLRLPVPAALRYGAFTRLWAGSIASSVGTQMNAVAAAWALYTLTHSTLALGIQGLCFSVPIALLPLVAGPIVDRLDSRMVLQTTLIVEAATAGGLAVAAATGQLRPWLLYAVGVVDASRLSFAIPAQTALTPLLVPKDKLLSAQSLSMAAWSSSALVGPAVGGLLLARTSPSIVFAANAAATLIAAAAVYTLHLPAATVPTSGSRPTEGLRYALRHRWVLGYQAVLICTNTVAIGTETLLPALTINQWHSSSNGYGLLRAAPGAAAVAIGIGMSLIDHPPRRPTVQITCGLIVMGIGLPLFTHMPTLPTAWLTLAAVSLAVTATQIITGTTLQQQVPQAYLGALGGLTAISMSGLAGIGAAATASAAQAIGPRAAVLATAAITVPLTVVALAISRKHQQPRHLPEPPQT